MADSELAEHYVSAFPASVSRGDIYGEVEPVMIDADVMGWASNESLSPVQKVSLRSAADQLSRSLDAFPSDARPYFDRLLRIARQAAAD